MQDQKELSRGIRIKTMVCLAPKLCSFYYPMISFPAPFTAFPLALPPSLPSKDFTKHAPGPGTMLGMVSSTCSYPKSVETEGQMSNSPGWGKGGKEFHTPDDPPKFSPSQDHFTGRARNVWPLCDIYTRLVTQKSSAKLGGPQGRAQTAPRS